MFSGRLEKQNKQNGRPVSHRLRLFDFSSETTEQNSTKVDRKHDLKILYQVCVFCRSVNKNGHPGRSVKKVAHFTQVHVIWPFGPLVKGSAAASELFTKSLACQKTCRRSSRSCTFAWTSCVLLVHHVAIVRPSRVHPVDSCGHRLYFVWPLATPGIFSTRNFWLFSARNLWFYAIFIAIFHC